MAFRLLSGHEHKYVIVFMFMTTKPGPLTSRECAGLRARKRLRMGVRVKLLGLFELCCLLRPRTGALRLVKLAPMPPFPPPMRSERMGGGDHPLWRGEWKGQPGNVTILGVTGCEG